VYSTVLGTFGVRAPSSGHSPSLRGEGSADLRGGFAEYHGLGATSAAFMLRRDSLKLIYYPTDAPQLFDLADDPHELVDLAGDPRYRGQLDALIEDLRSIVDPEQVDRAARQAQERMIAEHGGREAILAQGFTIPFTPVPKGDSDVEH
jgi:choline-sulfatase